MGRPAQLLHLELGTQGLVVQMGAGAHGAVLLQSSMPQISHQETQLLPQSEDEKQELGWPPWSC